MWCQVHLPHASHRPLPPSQRPVVHPQKHTTYHRVLSLLIQPLPSSNPDPTTLTHRDLEQTLEVVITSPEGQPLLLLLEVRKWTPLQNPDRRLGTEESSEIVRHNHYQWLRP